MSKKTDELLERLRDKKDTDECPMGGRHKWKIRRGPNRGLFTMVGGDKIFDCENGCGATKTEP
jgi:hypothetical protein